ncbi:MAG TPA: substrate-binding domain-containing protein [Burkholderiaceae bacterium]|nr:substrate-binding domain-containing protein [Burkholderiaceae bacterium]
MLFSLVGPVAAQEDPALFLDNANSKVARAMAFKNLWDGPTTGPKLAQSKFIVFIGADLSDPSELKIANSLKEVATSVGWSVQALDCYGVASRRAESFSRAMALKPAAIIFADADAKSEAKQIAMATDKKIPVIGWHAALTNGPSDGLFTNIGADPKESGQMAALLSVVESKAKAGVVVLSNPESVYLATKSQGMITTIKQCQTCALLEVQPISSTDKPEQVIQKVAALEAQFGARLTYILATNDRIADILTSPAAAALPNDKVQIIAAGNGSSNAYARIRAKKLQVGTVPEPLNMQAWQLIDEANRAIDGVKPSGYVPDSYVVTQHNISFHGGQNDTFDPANGYQEVYKKIWGR